MTWEQSGGYPVPGSDRHNSIAWAVLDEIATEPMMHGALRESLYVRLGALVESGDQALANEVLHAFLDCWSLGAVVDDARERWWQSSDPESLAILVRAAEVIRLAIGWQTGPSGPWPIPDESWFAANERPWVASPGLSTASIAEVGADDLVQQNEHWMAEIRKGGVTAVLISGEPSDESAFGIAMRQVRTVLPRQRDFERAGFAAAHVENIPEYGAGWSEASAGSAGDPLQPMADGVVVPALDTGAPMAMVGWLVWPKAHLPIRVHPISIAILNEIDGQIPSAQVAAKLDIPLDRWDDLVESLLILGAATTM